MKERQGDNRDTEDQTINDEWLQRARLQIAQKEGDYKISRNAGNQDAYQQSGHRQVQSAGFVLVY